MLSFPRVVVKQRWRIPGESPGAAHNQQGWVDIGRQSDQPCEDALELLWMFVRGLTCRTPCLLIILGTIGRKHSG